MEGKRQPRYKVAKSFGLERAEDGAAGWGGMGRPGCLHVAMEACLCPRRAGAPDHHQEEAQACIAALGMGSMAPLISLQHL